MKKHIHADADTSAHYRRGRESAVREYARQGKTGGRPRLSVTDLSTVRDLRAAFVKDLGKVAELVDSLRIAGGSSQRSLDLSSHHLDHTHDCIDSANKAVSASVIFTAGSLNILDHVAEQLTILIKERSPRREAGAPEHVLRKARAARYKQKGGAK